MMDRSKRNTRAIALVSRDPYRIRSGRTAVIRTALDNLCRIFGTVDCFVFDDKNEDLSQTPEGLRCHWLGKPRFVSAMRAKCREFMRGLAISELLFWQPEILEQLQECLASYGIERSSYCYCDSIRLYSYARMISNCVHLDLDDLLSRRYEEFSRLPMSQRIQVLGHFEEGFPTFLRWTFSLLSGPLLAFEGKRLNRRETLVTKEANTTTLVSKKECDLLTQRCGVSVKHLPMAADTSGSFGWTHREPIDSRISLVFVGMLSYLPNIEALKEIRSKILPECIKAGIDVKVAVVGRRVPAVENQIRHERIRFVGYVVDLAEHLQHYDALIAPIRSGSGIKTKVLDAIALGLPVLGTPKAFEGITVNYPLEWTSHSQLLRCLRDLRSIETARTVRNATQTVLADFSSRAIAKKWDVVVGNSLCDKGNEYDANS